MGAVCGCYKPNEPNEKGWKKSKKKVFKKKHSLKTKSQNSFMNDPYDGDNELTMSF